MKKIDAGATHDILSSNWADAPGTRFHVASLRMRRVLMREFWRALQPIRE